MNINPNTTTSTSTSTARNANARLIPATGPGPRERRPARSHSPKPIASPHSTNGARWPRGSITRAIIESIGEGYHTLRAIADHLGLEYRCINAVVASLEQRNRVRARDECLPRGAREFHTIGSTERVCAVDLRPRAPLPYSVFNLAEPPQVIPAAPTGRIHRCMDDTDSDEPTDISRAT